MNLRSLLQGLAAAAVIIVIVYFQTDGNKHLPPSATGPEGEALPYSYIFNSRTWMYEKNGALAEVVESSSTKYFAERNQSILEQPRYFSHNGSNQTWAASARRGDYFHRNGKLELSNDVLLHNDANQADLKTESLSVDTVNKIAASSTPVAVVQGSNKITALGMSADLKAQTLQFKGKVNSIYVPTN